MIKPVAWIDDAGRLVRGPLLGDGGYVGFNRAIPDSWRPVYSGADLPVEALDSFKYTVDQCAEFGRVDLNIINVWFTPIQYNALRELLLAVKP